MLATPPTEMIKGSDQDYRIAEQIGIGRYCIVSKAAGVSTGHIYAIKKSHNLGSYAQQSFRKEANCLSKLRHVSILCVTPLKDPCLTVFSLILSLLWS